MHHVVENQPHFLLQLQQRPPTSGSGRSVSLHGDALLVVCDPQHAALLGTCNLRRAPGEDHRDPAAIDVQVLALPYVHILSSRLSGRNTVAQNRTEHAKISVLTF